MAKVIISHSDGSVLYQEVTKESSQRGFEVFWDNTNVPTFYLEIFLNFLSSPN